MYPILGSLTAKSQFLLFLGYEHEKKKLLSKLNQRLGKITAEEVFVEDFVEHLKVKSVFKTVKDSGALHTYPSPYPMLTLASHFGAKCCIRRGEGELFSRILYIPLGSCLHSWLTGGKTVIFNDQNNKVSADILFKKYVQFNTLRTPSTVESFQLDKTLNCEFIVRYKNCPFGSVRSYSLW